MITQLECSTLFGDSAYTNETRLLDDMRLLMICAGISMARESGNPIWAQSNDMADKFNSLFTKYCEILKEVATDYNFELKYTSKLCEYIGFMIIMRHHYSPYSPEHRSIAEFHRSDRSNFIEASEFLKERLDDNVYQKFFKTLQPHTDFTNLYVNASNFCDIISYTPALKEDILLAIIRLQKDPVGKTEFFKIAKKYATLCIH